jgi:hypothetical protein
MVHELIPELHDILKLTYLQHNFSDFGPFQGYAPNTATWKGVLQHHCKEDFPAYPTDSLTFLLHMADGLASGFSRHPQSIKKQDTQQESSWTTYCLWNPKRVLTDQRLTRHEDVLNMLEFLGTDPSFDQFFTRYRYIFESRAEDAHPGMNITTLETHVRLVGRLYRFLRQSQVFTVQDDEVGAAAAQSAQAVADLRERKKLEWHLYLILCRPRLLANPFRARDMNSFACLQEFLQEVSGLFADKLLFASTEQLLFCSDDLKILDDLRALAAPRSIALDIVRKRERIRDSNLEFDPRRARERKKRINPEFQSLYPALEAEVTPPICEICQTHRATKVWPQDYLAVAQPESGDIGQGRDYLCETCFAMRSRPSELKKLAHWEEWAQGDLIWARFGLDFDQLQDTLQAAYLNHLRSLDPNTPEERADVRFSLLAEFQRDYEKYLADLQQRLLGRFGGSRTEIILPGFFCFQAQEGGDVFVVLDRFHQSVKDFFPSFLSGVDCPLRVSVAFCGVKYPFFEVWRAWQAQEGEIEITAVGHGGLTLKVRSLEKFLRLADFPFRQSALHKLADISRVSQALAELSFRSGGERGECHTFEHLGQFLPLGLTFDGILTLAKLKG